MTCHGEACVKNRSGLEGVNELGDKLPLVLHGLQSASLQRLTQCPDAPPRKTAGVFIDFLQIAKGIQQQVGMPLQHLWVFQDTTVCEVLKLCSIGYCLPQLL